VKKKRIPKRKERGEYGHNPPSLCYNIHLSHIIVVCLGMHSSPVISPIISLGVLRGKPKKNFFKRKEGVNCSYNPHSAIKYLCDIISFLALPLLELPSVLYTLSSFFLNITRFSQMVFLVPAHSKKFNLLQQWMTSHCVQNSRLFLNPYAWE
jgi:hypothetical protein